MHQLLHLQPQPSQLACQQHLAYLRSVHSKHNPWLAQVALEAHLHLQQQASVQACPQMILQRETPETTNTLVFGLK